MKVAEGIERPNGITLSRDEKTLYVNNTSGEYLLAFDVKADGTLANRRNFAKYDGVTTAANGVNSGADGLAIDEQGRVYVATSTGVQVFDVKGTLLGTIPLSRAPQNLAFAGKDKKTLYVVGRGSAFKVDLMTAGLQGEREVTRETVRSAKSEVRSAECEVRSPKSESEVRGWRTDLTYFFVGSLLVQVLTILTLKPAMVFFNWAVIDGVQQWIRSWPGVVQFLGLLFVADLTQYWVHRTFHAVPWLWRFHAVHHSAEQMDWLAGSRLHLVDIAVTRGLTYVPIYVLGFGDGPLFAYLVVVSVQATFIHANVRFEFGPLRWVVATPQFHHWHHAAEREAIDKNFAVHLPVLDGVFGTMYLPGGWPRAYGIGGGPAVPPGYARQFAWPFGGR